MNRSLAIGIALALTATGLLVCSAPRASERSLPMRFDLRLQGPADVCGTSCKTLISASGAITADSARDFISFMRGRDLAGATVVLDSDGGSVHGAIALGREIRRRGLSTTVGSVVDLASPAANAPRRATLSPRADCESMCAFVLLGGVQRMVPQEARVMVHQIWLGDRRDDPTAASYSAEDLVLVQRDIGKLALYTAEMGVSIDLLDLSLRIPPWEPMRALTRDEMRRMHLATQDIDAPAAATVAASQPATSRPTPRSTDGAQLGAISERRWAMIDRAGVATLARHHPLTIEGETIGSFDLMVSCGAGGESFDISYAERRQGGDRAVLPSRLSEVTLRIGAKQASLKVASSERRSASDELVSVAAATVPTALFESFASAGNRSVLVETRRDSQVTMIRLGNTGAQQNLPQLAASCRKTPGDRADLPVRKTGGLAAAQ